MDIATNICCGCLCAGRKMIVIDNVLKKQCFLQIISEIRMDHKCVSLCLCWECEALLSRFCKFRRQIHAHYKIFYEHIEQNLNVLDLKREPTLKIQVLESICTNTIRSELVDNALDNLKEEDSEEQIDQKYSDDNISLNGFDDLTSVANHAAVKEDTSEVILNQLNDAVDLSFQYADKSVKIEKNIDMSDNSSDGDQFLSEISFIEKEKTKRNKPTALLSKNNETTKLKNARGKDYIKNKKANKVRTNKNNGENNPSQYTLVKLTREEIEEERRTERETDSYVNAMYKCDSCVQTFSNKHDLSDHFKNKHNMDSPKSFKCDICACVFRSSVSYLYHKNKHMVRYKCTVCSRLFSRLNAALKHFDLVHWTGLPEIDSHQGKGTEMLSDDSFKSRESFPCRYCDKIFKWRSSLRKHVETHNIEAGTKRKPYCEPCGVSFTSTCNLQKHIQSSAKHKIQLKLRKLEDSKDTSQDPQTEKEQIEEIKSTINKDMQQFACPQCDRKFQWLGNLRRHIRSHEAKDGGELVCVPCKRRFSSIATFKQHMAISKRHVSEQDMQHMCPDCGRRFPIKLNLQDHIDWYHRKVYKYICQLCQKPFKSHTSLYLHKQVVHNKNKADHLCDHCGKSFPTRGKLGCHMTAVHTAESPYKCHQCGSKFSWSSCLSRHVRRVHSKKNKQTDSEAADK